MVSDGMVWYYKDHNIYKLICKLKEIPFTISAGFLFFEEHDKLKTKFIWRIKIFISVFKIKANEGRHAKTCVVLTKGGKDTKGEELNTLRQTNVIWCDVMYVCVHTNLKGTLWISGEKMYFLIGGFGKTCSLN